MNSVIGFLLTNTNSLYDLIKPAEHKKDEKETNEQKTDDKNAKLSLKDKWSEHIALIEEKTGLSGNFVIGFFIFCLCMVLFGFLEKMIMTIIGTFYPAYWSIKSIESDSEDIQEERHWLTYWVVFSLFTVFDLLTLGFVLKFIPFYFFFKIIFLIWLFMPNFKGATILYNLIIVRLYAKYEKHIEEAANKIKGNLDKIINDETDKFASVGTPIKGLLDSDSPVKHVKEAEDDINALQSNLSKKLD